MFRDKSAEYYKVCSHVMENEKNFLYTRRLPIDTTEGAWSWVSHFEKQTCVIWRKSKMYPDGGVRTSFRDSVISCY